MTMAGHTLYGSAVGLGGALAGWLIALLFYPKRRFAGPGRAAQKSSELAALQYALEFSAGVMLAVVCFDLIPEAMELAPFGDVLAGVLGGLGLLALTQILLGRRVRGRGRGFLVAALCAAIGIAAHNLPEGVAIGAGLAQSPRLGLRLALLILLHDVPEGVGVALPLGLAGRSRWQSLILTLLSGLPTGLGALMGSAAGQVSPRVMALCLAGAGGAMLWVALCGLLPLLRRPIRGAGVACVAGVLAGLCAAVWLK